MRGLTIIFALFYNVHAKNTPAWENDPLIAITDLGPVRGRWNPSIGTSIKNFFSWKKKDVSRIWSGIPFARPPVGPLRFKAPLPAIPWANATSGSNSTKILETTRFPAPCMQNFISLWRRSSEDCLYLNVFAPPESRTPPKHTNKTLPVMVWLYGGAFYFGDSYAK